MVKLKLAIPRPNKPSVTPKESDWVDTAWTVLDLHEQGKWNGYLELIDPGGDVVYREPCTLVYRVIICGILGAPTITFTAWRACILVGVRLTALDGEQVVMYHPAIALTPGDKISIKSTDFFGKKSGWS
jgi:hypothetical protein